MGGSNQDSERSASAASDPWADAVPGTRAGSTAKGDQRDSKTAAARSKREHAARNESSHQKQRTGAKPGGRNQGGPRGDAQATGARPTTRLDELAHRLVSELESRVQRHPAGKLVGSRRESVPITLEVPIRRGQERLHAFGKELNAALDAAVLSLVSERAVAESHTAFCLRCGSHDCEHAKPEPKQVFTGYGASGTPQFADYSQSLLNLKDAGMSQLYGASGALVTRLWTENELSHSLLPAFRETDSGYRLLGQVTAGWFWLPDAWEDEAKGHGYARNFALSFQVGLIDVASQPRRLTLNVVGTSPTEAPLESLHDAFGELPWHQAERWCRQALGDVERSLRRLPPAKRAASQRKAPDRPDLADADEVWYQRVGKILAGFERRLARRERAKGRKTRHAESRRKQKRPTGHALADLAAAPAEAVLRDTRKDTLVVLGDRGRTHIFNDNGRLVTSIVYGAEAIERRMAGEVWVPVEPEIAAGLQQRALERNARERS